MSNHGKETSPRGNGPAPVEPPAEEKLLMSARRSEDEEAAGELDGIPRKPVSFASALDAGQARKVVA